MIEGIVEGDYQKNLDLRAFSQLLKDNAQGYKYYWLEAILELSGTRDDDLSFDEIFDLMIFNAWYSVTYYHLRLGPTVNGKAVNYLEHAVKCLNKQHPELTQGAISDDRIKQAITNSKDILKTDKLGLCHYVPHRLLSPFFKTAGLEEGLGYISSDSCGKLIDYMVGLDNRMFLYSIIDGRSFSKKIRMSEEWLTFLRMNRAIIYDWIQFNKVQYLQDRNPGVPEIINKIHSDRENDRKLESVRDLWRTISKYTGKAIIDIYSHKSIEDKELSIDHFVPRSYVSNDELWNLTPMRKSLNSSKNNKLPPIEDFLIPFSDSQYILYETIFPKNSKQMCEKLITEFNKCRKHNMNSIASERLFVGGHSEIEFRNMLQETIIPVYRAAEMMGYEKWKIAT